MDGEARTVTSNCLHVQAQVCTAPSTSVSQHWLQPQIVGQPSLTPSLVSMAERAVAMPDGKVHPEQFRGWLLKWTNYIKGYQKRWFVLSNGLLSYYRFGNLRGGEGV